VVHSAHARSEAVTAGAELDAMLAALADPARRGAIDLLRREPRRAGELAGALEVSAARMSQHLRVLRECGLVEEAGVEGDARVRVYRLRAERAVPQPRRKRSRR